MKVAKLVKMSGELLKFLSENDVKRDDWRYIALYEQYTNMRSMGMKYRVTIEILSKEYNISRANVERIVKRLGAEC